ncbi:hypothetical protein QN382_03520 [Pseudomonas sp. 10B1]|uniref:hypothetical protein n=1 Tax=unclassified Pseudomonas TaxID=196821 RepID=UPI002B239993|nr:MULTISPECIES: hypothetical protein [unclassified Pseudomonas]MEA9997196.1 hypothetical protein [Pseudomonas sp. AA4]MEB0088403.1 hypothetical protein [Pseudomonas sp. RTI1]MEB0128189.1 hypothetical protein [Pseudomonas sp. CCC1.2]MEB0155488.1 hypothetical protein [Pseudomonas sp. CCC4.3]MEB0181119.1 hypothetical protein [Pseudomonas sp. CCC3.2]
MIVSTEVTNVANEAVDQLQVAKEYLDWFDSLSWAISVTLKAGHSQHAQRLAGVVQYLAGDYQSLLESDIKSFNVRLETLELRN